MKNIKADTIKKENGRHYFQTDDMPSWEWNEINKKEFKLLEKQICTCSCFESKKIIGEIKHNKKCKVNI